METVASWSDWSGQEREPDRLVPMSLNLLKIQLVSITDQFRLIEPSLKPHLSTPFNPRPKKLQIKRCIVACGEGAIMMVWKLL